MKMILAGTEDFGVFYCKFFCRTNLSICHPVYLYHIIKFSNYFPTYFRFFFNIGILGIFMRWTGAIMRSKWMYPDFDYHWEYRAVSPSYFPVAAAERFYNRSRTVNIIGNSKKNRKSDWIRYCTCILLMGKTVRLSSRPLRLLMDAESVDPEALERDALRVFVWSCYWIFALSFVICSGILRCSKTKANSISAAFLLWNTDRKSSRQPETIRWQP